MGIAHPKRDKLVITAIVLWSAFLVFFADTRITTGLDADRYALMESLVERGTAVIDNSSMDDIDKVKIGDHFYSGKPPVLSFLGAGVYAILYHGLGWSFKTHSAAVVRVMISTFVVLPSALTLWLIWAFLRRRTNYAAAVVALVALASLFLPYSRCFTNHPPANFFLLAAFISFVRAGEDSPARRMLLAGFFAVFSATLDLIPGTIFWIALFGVSLVRRRWRDALNLCVGALIPAALQTGLNMATVGMILPSYYAPGGYEYEGSIWKAGATASGDYEPSLGYGRTLLHYIAGRRAVFAYMPLILVTLFAARKGLSERLKEAWLAAVITLGALFIIVPRHMSMSGGNYGPRHFIGAAVLLYCFLFPPVNDLPVSRRRRNLVLVLAVWSFALAAIGFLDPWTPLTMSKYAPLDVLAAQLARRASGWSDGAESIVRTTAHSPAFGYYELGRTYWESGKITEAMMAYRKSLQLDPKRTQALYALGTLAGETGRATLAADSFEKLTQIDPENAGAWSNLGITLLGLGDTQRARPALEKGLSLNPQSRAALNGLVQIHLRQNETEKARDYARKLQAIDPQSELAVRVLSQH